MSERGDWPSIRPNTAPTLGELMDQPAKSYAQGVADERARIEKIIATAPGHQLYGGWKSISFIDRDEILRRIRDKERPT